MYNVYFNYFIFIFLENHNLNVPNTNVNDIPNNEYLINILNQCKYFGENRNNNVVQNHSNLQEPLFQHNPSLDLGFQKKFIESDNSDKIHNFQKPNIQQHIGTIHQNNHFLDNSDRFANND